MRRKYKGISVGVLARTANEDLVFVVLAVNVQVEIDELGFLADLKVDAVDAAVGLEVDHNFLPLFAQSPPIAEFAFVLQVVWLKAGENTAFDVNLAGKLVQFFGGGGANVPVALGTNPDGIAGRLAGFEALRLAKRVERLNLLILGFSFRPACLAACEHAKNTSCRDEAAPANETWIHRTSP